MNDLIGYYDTRITLYLDSCREEKETKNRQTNKKVCWIIFVGYLNKIFLADPDDNFE